MIRFASVAVATSALATVFAAPAFAQDVAAGPAAANISEIVVTGTLIRGAAPVGSPIIGVNRQDIEQQGLATTEDILKAVPQITNIGPSSNSGAVTVQNSNLNNTRADAINIRGIGPQATLPLLDGRRLPPGGAGAQLFDASSIPSVALARIDVVADGASATYGSDAVAGVVNFILRKNFEGLEASARYGFANNYFNDQMAAILGHQGQNYGAIVAFQYDHNSALMQSDRAKYFQCNETSFGYANNCVTANGAPQGVNVGAPGNLVFPSGATKVYGLPGGSGVGVTQAQLSTTPNSISNTTYQDLLSASTRYSAVFSGHYDVGKVTFWTEDYYSRRQTPIDVGYLNFSAAVPSTNPNFIPVAGQSTTSETVQYALGNDVGPVIRTTYEENWQASVGFDANLFKDYNLTAYYEHNKNHEYYNSPGLNSAFLATALACTTGVCFNPYGAGGSNSNMAAAASFVGFQTQNSYFNSDVVNAKIDGSLFSLPAGAVKIAVGGEWHRDHILNYNYQNTTAASTSVQNVAVTTNSIYQRTVSSAFAEMIVPIVSDANAMRGIQRLSLDVAGRYDSYSDVGSTTNPKVGVVWSPARDFTLRGSYGTSFRAPTVCDSNPLCTPGVLASSSAITSLYGQRTANAITLVGGNSTVKPETATTYSAGLEYKPSSVPGLTASINYFNIDYRNVIYTPGNSLAAYTNPAYGRFITVNPTQAQVAAVTALPYFAGLPNLPGCATLSATNTSAYQCLGAILDGRRNNAGEERLQGLDLSASYHFDTAIGRWTVGATGTYLLNYDVAVVQGAPFVASVNQFSSIDAPLGDLLRFRARGQISYSRDGFDANAFINYTNGYSVVGLITPTQNDHVSAYVTLDATLGYTFGSGSMLLHDLRLSIDALNLFDAAPPLAVVGTSQQYDPSAANVIGRQIAVMIRKKF